MSIPDDPDEYFRQLERHFYDELREPTAYHESGHFVLGLFTGDFSIEPVEGEKIDLVPKQDRGDWGFARFRQMSSAHLNSERERLSRAVHLCGGYAAQWRYEPEDEHHVETVLDEQMNGTEEGDFSDAYDLLGDRMQVRSALDHARRLVDDPDIWGAVEHVAQTLLDMPPEGTILEGPDLVDAKMKVVDLTAPARDRVQPTP
jgi:hypothetical protein